ncbi:uncharacterized protein Dsimw501_GD21092, isoform A [Drosophila simulans]|nr:uncharacterized protein Dsimw501_GD21092, isoform A [Drosophila simulans]
MRFKMVTPPRARQPSTTPFMHNALPGQRHHQRVAISMSFAQFFVACCLAIVLLAVSNTRAAVQGPPLCQSGIVEEMPPHIRKVCQALENSDQLTSALKSYINNEASALVANSDDLLKNYNKRTDVDHVFLRFGKRR